MEKNEQKIDKNEQKMDKQMEKLPQCRLSWTQQHTQKWEPLDIEINCRKKG